MGEASYIRIMSQKDVDKATSRDHFARMKAFSEKFQKANDENKCALGLFGAVDVGKDACWWDYGQLKLYSQNSLLLLDDKNPECKLLRKFLNIKEGPRYRVHAPCNVQF